MLKIVLNWNLILLACDLNLRLKYYLLRRLDLLLADHDWNACGLCYILWIMNLVILIWLSLYLLLNELWLLAAYDMSSVNAYCLLLILLDVFLIWYLLQVVREFLLTFERFLNNYRLLYNLFFLYHNRLNNLTLLWLFILKWYLLNLRLMH